MEKLFEFIEHIGKYRVLVQTRDIRDDAITSDKIKDGSVNNDKLADLSIAWGKLSKNLQNIIASREEGGVALSSEFGDSELLGITQKKLTEEHQHQEEENERTSEAISNILGLIDVINRIIGTGGSVDERISTAVSDAKSEIVDGAENDTLKKLETNTNNAISSIDDRLQTVESLAEISVDGGSIGIATKSDFDNPTSDQRAKVPTVGSLLDAGFIPKKIAITPTGTQIIKPGTLYQFGTCGSLTIAFDSDPSFADAIKEYMFEFVVSDVDFALTLPEGVRWNTEPDYEPGNTYQVSILNNLAVYAEFEPISNE